MKEPEPKKVLKIFGWASFLNDFGSDIIFPLWPIFLTSVLGANMAILGFIDGLGDAIVSISQAVSGYVADKTGKRKIFVWLGYAFAGLARVGYALAPAWQYLIPFRVLDRAGKMRGAPRDAIIADISTSENRGRNFGYLRMMDNLGAIEPVQKTLVSELSVPEFWASTLGSFQMVVGLTALPASLIAGLLWDKVSLAAPFIFSAILTIIAIIMLLFVKERRVA